MGLIKTIFISTALLMVANTTLAKVESLDTSILPPGARIVAGDPGKNEFYILDKGEKLPVTTANSSYNENQNSQKHASSTVQIAQHKPEADLTKKQVSTSVIALNHVNLKVKKSTQKPNDKKVIAKLEYALQDKDRKTIKAHLHELAAKKEIALLNDAIKRGDQKIINASVQKLAGKKTFAKLRNALERKDHKEITANIRKLVGKKELTVLNTSLRHADHKVKNVKVSHHVSSADKKQEHKLASNQHLQKVKVTVHEKA